MRTCLTILQIFCYFTLFAAIPPGYYDSAENLSGSELKSALHDIIDGHNVRSYDFAWTALRVTDEDPGNSSNIIQLYTGDSDSKTNNGGGSNNWNREHTWPKFKGNFDETDIPGKDIHNLKPTDVSVNSDRGNLDFDDGGSQHSEASECYFDSDSWEPRDAVKGDVARIIFYMSTRYEGDDEYSDLEIVDYTGNSAPNFGKLSTLIQWHNDDPVDTFEQDRNDAIYGYQNNRNPYIDHPEYVGYIWGGETPSEEGETFANFPETSSSYNDGTFTGQDGSTWEYESCRGDELITDETPCMGKDQIPNGRIESGAISGGCETLNFDYRRAFGTSLDFDVYVNAVLVTTITGGDGSNQNSGDLTVDIIGDFVIKFEQNTGGGQACIDNVSWTNYSDGDITDIMISEISESSSTSSEYIELYNPNSTSYDLTNVKLVRVEALTNNSEWVYDIGSDGSGDVIIPASGILIIARGASKSTFESNWGTTLGTNVNYNVGHAELYFASGTARRWRLRTDSVKTADTDDGTIIDDTDAAAGGSGDRTYQQAEGSWITESYSGNSTPGELDGDQALPVTLSSFTAFFQNNTAQLLWTTQSEQNNSHWNVYRSISENFGQAQKINNEIIEGSGNSTTLTDYEFIDDQFNYENSILYYWIESVSLGGFSELYGPISLEINIENDNSAPPEFGELFGLFPNYPNPFNPSTSISFKLTESGIAVVTIFSLKGQKVIELFNDFVEAENIYSISWNGRDRDDHILPSGVYLYNLKSSSTNQNRKMLLIK